MNRISVADLRGTDKETERKIKIRTSEILKILKKNNVVVEIYLIDGKRMRFLNKKFRGKDKTTTVLSFKEPRNFILPPSKFRKIGEIYLNTPKTERQKLKNLDFLIIHGILHLLGYTHNKKSDRIKMEKLENWIIRELEN